MRTSTKTLVSILTATILIVGALVAFATDVVELDGSEDIQVPVRTDVDPLGTLETSTTSELSDAFHTVANAVQPRVVQITTERQADMQQRNPFEGTPFEDFFRGPEQRGPAPPERGLGSGVIVRENGYIVTNSHVVAGTDEVTVRLAGGETYNAEIVGTDPSSDLAVVKIDEDGLPVISYADMQNVRVGNWVMALGSPFSPRLGNSVTAGIVSATGRTGFQGLARGGEYAAVQDFIQTDAAINPGNSGGALVDLHGQLVGINTAIISRTGGNVGIGFAVPISIVKNVVPQLIEEGAVARGFLGVSFQPVTPALTQALELPSGAAQIVQVTEDGPAAEVGLQSGDVVVAIDGQTLQTTAQLGTLIGGMQPGDEVDITFIRDEERRTVTVELGARPGAQQRQPTADDEEEPSPTEAMEFEELGLEMANLTPRRSQMLEQQFGMQLPDDLSGVLVTGVEPGTMAYDEANLRRGMIITQVGGQAIEDVEAFQDIYDEVDRNDYFRLTVVRPAQGGIATFQTALTKPE